jgi:hypothetical protein
VGWSVARRWHARLRNAHAPPQPATTESALCDACHRLQLRKQLASSSRLTLDEPVPTSYAALMRTKSQSIRVWVEDVSSGAPSRSTSFDTAAVSASPAPTAVAAPSSPTPRARSPRTFARPSLLRPSASAASLRVCRQSSKPAGTRSSALAVPLPPPAAAPICARGSWAPCSVLRALAVRTCTPADDDGDAATLVDLAGAFEKAALFPVDDLADLDDDARLPAQRSLSAAELGRRVVLQASRHRASRLALPA